MPSFSVGEFVYSIVDCSSHGKAYPGTGTTTKCCTCGSRYNLDTLFCSPRCFINIFGSIFKDIAYQRLGYIHLSYVFVHW